MGKNVQPITHKGKQIWLLDVANKDEKDALAGWDEAKLLMAREKDGFLGLVDARNTPMTMPLMNKAKEVAAMAKGDPRFRIALVGATGMAKSMGEIHAKTRRVNAHFCDTMEEAKDWLVQEADGTRKR
jgi:hypothetical protein